MSNNNVNENSLNHEFKSIINFMICFSNLKVAICFWSNNESVHVSKSADLKKNKKL